MPLFDYLCLDCGKLSEILVTVSADQPQCQVCGSSNLKKMISATLNATNSNMAETARRLGISRATLYRKVKQCALETE